MKAAQIDVVERTTQLLAGFNLSTAAPEPGPRLENAGHRDALLLVLEVLEMEAEARAQRKITRLRRAADAQAARVGARRVPGTGREHAGLGSARSGQAPRRLRDRQRAH